MAHFSISLEVHKDNGDTIEEEYPLAQFIIEEMLTDNLFYNNQQYQKIFDEFTDGLENRLLVNEQHFVQNPDLTSLVVDLTTSENIFKRELGKTNTKFHTKTESEKIKTSSCRIYLFIN